MKRLAAIVFVLVFTSVVFTETAKTVWTCSMHPRIRAAEAGACPICGMELVAIENAESGGKAETVEKVRKDFSVLDLSDAQAVALGAWLDEQEAKPDPEALANFMSRFLETPLQAAIFQHVIDFGRADQPLAGPDATIDPDASGGFQADNWTYVLRITQPDPDNARKIGKLFYGQREVPPAEEINSYYETPWGKLYWLGPERRVGVGGWMPQPSAVEGEASGVKLPAPSLVDVRLAAADDGKARAALVGQLIAIDLEGNPTTGYQWVLADIDGEAVRQLGGVKFVAPREAPAERAQVGAGGMFQATFEAVKVGKAAIRMAYLRPWEKDKAPAKTFSVTIEVRAGGPVEGAAAAVKATAVIVRVRAVDGQPRYTVLGKETGSLDELLAALKTARLGGAKELLIDAPKDMPQGHVADVVNVAKAADFGNIGFTTASP
jgi:predicted secreted protein